MGAKPEQLLTPELEQRYVDACKESLRRYEAFLTRVVPRDKSQVHYQNKANNQRMAPSFFLKTQKISYIALGRNGYVDSFLRHR